MTYHIQRSESDLSQWSALFKKRTISNVIMKPKDNITEAVLNLIPHLLRLPSSQIWCDYDEEADVMYISFRKPQHADQSEMEDNVIAHYAGEQIVGFTVIGASCLGK